MSPSLRYAATGSGVIALVVLGLWPFLDASAFQGVLLAAAIAVPVQVTAFRVLHRFRGELTGFLAAWVGGTFLRVAVIAVVAIAAIRSGMEGAVPMLLALTGFFFGLLLLEPVFFRIAPNKTVEA